MIGARCFKTEVDRATEPMARIRLTAELMSEEEGGFSVYCPELDIYTQGETEEECLANLKEAAELHLEEPGSLSSLRRVLLREVEIEVDA